VFAESPVLQDVSERPRNFCLRKASGSGRGGRRRQCSSRQPSGSKMARQGTRGAACLRSGNRLHSCGGRHQSAGAAQRRSLAYQLCRVDVSRFRSAALVSAGAVTAYASHSTDLSRIVTFVLLCLIKPISGNRYGPGGSSCQQTSDNNLGVAGINDKKTGPQFFFVLGVVSTQLAFRVKTVQRRKFQFEFQFFTLNLENNDKTKSRGVDCDRAKLD